MCVCFSKLVLFPEPFNSFVRLMDTLTRLQSRRRTRRTAISTTRWTSKHRLLSPQHPTSNSTPCPPTPTTPCPPTPQRAVKQQWCTSAASRTGLPSSRRTASRQAAARPPRLNVPSPSNPCARQPLLLRSPTRLQHPLPLRWCAPMALSPSLPHGANRGALPFLSSLLPASIFGLLLRIALARNFRKYLFLLTSANLSACYNDLLKIWSIRSYSIWLLNALILSNKWRLLRFLMSVRIVLLLIVLLNLSIQFSEKLTSLIVLTTSTDGV